MVRMPHTKAVMAVTCPKCGAPPTKRCMNPQGSQHDRPHAARIKKAGEETK